ncbi:MAG: DUF86 domain-containing protein [Parabacteroides sp.]|nr:DUF86 domain-containing protein [Parabacteroides sp.]
MFKRELALGCLKDIQKALTLMEERSAIVTHVNDFLCSPEGMLRLDALCMNLIALGESVKNLDKMTNGELLALYPEVYWKGIMRIRDKIAHHYFDIDAEIVLATLKKDISPLSRTINRIIQDLEEDNDGI